MAHKKSRSGSGSAPALGWWARCWAMLWPLLGLIFALTVAAGAWFWRYAHTSTEPGPLPVTVEYQSGEPLLRYAEKLEQQGLLAWPHAFVWLAKWRGLSSSARAGQYVYNTPLTPLEILDKLAKGESERFRFTIIEGWNWATLKTALAAEPRLKHDVQAWSDAELAQRLHLPSPQVEGWFFPDSFFVVSGSSESKLLERAHRLMLERLQRAWLNRAPHLPIQSPEQALILASLIEKETGTPADRRRIAAVFHNRLQAGMRLQTDPSVIYGLGPAFDGNLTRKHLETDTPYNTYTRGGLPPTPIAMPGMAALEAALHPAPIRALYFVARGDGSSEFSDTLEAHNQAVRRYQLHR